MLVSEIVTCPTFKMKLGLSKKADIFMLNGLQLFTEITDGVKSVMVGGYRMETL
jgi:hypothetical protein